MNGREVAGSMKPELLIADASYPVSVASVTISGTPDGPVMLRRGAVLAENNETGKCTLLNGAEGTSAAYILAEPVTTSATDEVVGVAYDMGKFIKQSLVVADGYKLSVKDVKNLRVAGIFLENALM